MNIEDKYTKLRAAAIALIGCNDEKGELLEMAQALNTLDAGSDSDGALALQLIVALIETSGE